MSEGHGEGKTIRVRRLPWGLVGMLALVAATEFWLKAHESASFQENVPASWVHVGKAAEREAVGCEVLCFGDSMVKFGISPLLLEERTGLKAYNLAGYGGPPALSDLLLSRALAAGARPKVVVVDFMLNLLAHEPQFFHRSWKTIATVEECWDLSRTTGDNEFLAELLIGRVMPSARARDEIRRSVMLALEGHSLTAAVAHYVTPLWRNWRINRGGQLLARNPAWDGKTNPTDMALFPEKWKPNRASVRYMHRFLKRTEEHGIKVVWLLPPLSPATQRLREDLGVEGIFEKIVRNVQSAYPHVTVVDARHAGFDDRVFTDPVHVDRYGTAALTEGLAGIVHERVKGGAIEGARWVSLPAISAEPIEVPWEDLDQSRTALRAIEESRRR